MMDYFNSRDNFLDVGEQYINHLGSHLKEWHKFVGFYNDINRDRKAKDDEYKREQFIGEELDWKMLADNLSLFSSQVDNIKEMQGFDPHANLQIDQSIMQDNDMGHHFYKEGPLDNFSDAESHDGRNYRAGTVSSSHHDDLVPHSQQNVRSSMHLQCTNDLLADEPSRP